MDVFPTLSGVSAVAVIPDIGVVLFSFYIYVPASDSLLAWLPANVPPIAGATAVAGSSAVAGIPALSGNPAFAVVHILAVVPAFAISFILRKKTYVTIGLPITLMLSDRSFFLLSDYWNSIMRRRATEKFPFSSTLE